MRIRSTNWFRKRRDDGIALVDALLDGRLTKADFRKRFILSRRDAALCADTLLLAGTLSAAHPAGRGKTAVGTCEGLRRLQGFLKTDLGYGWEAFGTPGDVALAFAAGLSGFIGLLIAPTSFIRSWWIAAAVGTLLVLCMPGIWVFSWVWPGIAFRLSMRFGRRRDWPRPG